MNGSLPDNNALKMEKFLCTDGNVNTDLSKTTKSADCYFV